jgi:2-amino-4-hydroxy-6-hydroxymethyldihydropteridine diphosphokinase
VFLGLGSNLGDRWDHLRFAVSALGRGRVPAADEPALDVQLAGVSRVYETDPVGGPSGQGPFLNLVVELETGASPRELLALAASIEKARDRVRVEHWGPRTVDVDILLMGDLVVSEDDLVVPHPRIWDRSFVFVPLADLAPELVDPGLLDRVGEEIRFAGMIESSRS